MGRSGGLQVVIFFLLGCAASEPEPTFVSTDASTEVAVDAAPDLAVDTAALLDTKADTASCKLIKPFATKNVPCNECAQTKCCAEVNGCLGDPRCDDDYVNCSLACALLPADAGDAGAEKARCLAECGTMYPEGKKRYDAAFGCVDTKCASECG